MNRNDKKHDRTSITPLHALLAAAILGLMVMPLAFAGAADGPGATSSVVTDTKFKKLKKRVAAVERRAPSGPAGGALTGTYPNPQIGPSQVGTTQIADNAVTAAKLEPSQRSEIFQVETGTTSAVLASPIGAAKTVVQTLALPAGGRYLVMAQAELFNTAATHVSTTCSLGGVDGSSQGSDTYEGIDVLIGSGGISLTGISPGGTVTLACASEAAGTFAAFRRINAVRVG